MAWRLTVPSAYGLSLAVEHFGEVVEPLHHPFAEERASLGRRFESERVLGQVELHRSEFAFDRARDAETEACRETDLERQRQTFGVEQRGDPGVFRDVVFADIAVIDRGRHYRAFVMVRAAIVST